MVAVETDKPATVVKFCLHDLLFKCFLIPWSRSFSLKFGKPLATLTFNLTFMQMIAVKRVKVTNGNIANTCLSAATFFY